MDIKAVDKSSLIKLIEAMSNCGGIAFMFLGCGPQAAEVFYFEQFLYDAFHNNKINFYLIGVDFALSPKLVRKTREDMLVFKDNPPKVSVFLDRARLRENAQVPSMALIHSILYEKRGMYTYADDFFSFCMVFNPSVINTGLYENIFGYNFVVYLGKNDENENNGDSCFWDQITNYYIPIAEVMGDAKDLIVYVHKNLANSNHRMLRDFPELVDIIDKGVKEKISPRDEHYAYNPNNPHGRKYLYK